MVLRIVLAIGIVLVLGVLARELIGWRSGTRTVTSKQKGYRIASASLVVAVLAMILAGDKWLIKLLGPVAALMYWTVCFALAICVLLVALLDLKEVGMQFGEQRKRNLHHLGHPRDEDDGESEKRL